MSRKMENVQLLAPENANPWRRDWQPFKTSIFTKMTIAAQKVAAINLAQGFPDFDGPQEIKDAAVAAIQGGMNQYAPSNGLLALRESIAQFYKRKNDMDWDPQEEICIFSGATEALYVTLTALLQPGDEVVTFTPCYDSYAPGVHAAGAVLRCVPLQAPTWSLDLPRLQEAINDKTKIILLNTPHNPTGKVFARAELSALAAIAEKWDLTVVTDEVYEELVFDQNEHLSFASLPGMRQRTVTISSTSKTFSFTGWKIGYAMAPQSLMTDLRTLHQYTVFCSATPLQQAMVRAFSLDLRYYESLRADYQKKRDLLLEILRSVGFTCQPAQGTYFISAGFAELEQAKDHLDDVDFALHMTEQAGVAAVPFSPFYPGAQGEPAKYLRFAFCKNQAVLEQAGQRMAEFFKKR